MEVKKGYKQSEVGVIPDDWIPSTIGALIKFQGGSQPPRSTFVFSEKAGYIRLLQIRDYKTEKYATYVLKHLANRFCDKEDIMIGRYGPPIFQILRGMYGAYNVALIKAIPQGELQKEYAYHFLKQETLFSFVEKLSQRSSGQTGVDLKELRSYPFPLPPTKAEQTAIATALSDADALIQSLEKLIAKKRLIKQGAMQELLKPKEGWVVKKLGEIGKPYGGLSGKSKGDFENGKLPYIPFMNIMSNPVIDTNYLDYVNIDQGESQNQALKGDLFFNGSSETPEEVGMCSVLLEDIENLYLNSFCFGFRLYKELKNDGLYLSYFFRSSEGRKLFYSLAQGATRYNLSKSNFMKMGIEMPESKVQTRIATIISDIDTEISTLETKLAKYKQVKQGMMQELLTGRIRVI